MHAHATAFASYGVGLDAPAYTKSVVSQALNLYDALGLEAAVEYYSSSESVDDQWYVFIVDEEGYTIAHHNPVFLGRDPSLRVDATGYFYGTTCWTPPRPAAESITCWSTPKPETTARSTPGPCATTA